MSRPRRDVSRRPRARSGGGRRIARAAERAEHAGDGGRVGHDGAEGHAAPAPRAVLYVRVERAAQAIGRPCRWVREFAAKHRVPRLPGKMPVYRADALLALFAAERTGVHEAGAVDEPVTADAVLSRLGRRVGGAR